jgi:pimeloyl-ACP methyl ester carboxylesterase
MPELVKLAHHDNGRSTGVLVSEEEQVRFEIRRAPTNSNPAGKARPMVLLVPILAGGRELMGLVAQRLAAHDFDVAFCERAGRALSPPQRGPELNELFRRTVLHQRLLLKWLRHSDQPPPSLHVLGISMGGIISTVLAAIDHDLRSAAICLAGADLANLMLVSSEDRVQNWLSWRQETDGIGLDNLRWELNQSLSHEPGRYAASVPTEKVLFVSAALDTVVPRRNQSLLWEGLGRPLRLDLPFGHYTAAVVLDRVIGAAADHFHAHCP